MASIFSRGPAESLVGSVTVHTGSIDEEFQNRRRGGVDGWQTLAYSYWDQLGELHYPTTYIARMVTKINLDITVDGNTVDDEDPRKTEIIDAATYGVGLYEAVRLIALNYQISGEAWYVGKKEAETEKFKWKPYAPITKDLRKILEPEEVIRVHALNSHPVDTEHADSAFRPLLGPAKELLTLEALSRSQTRSRISQAGILLHAEEIEFPDTDDFGDDLEEAMIAPIADETHASAVVPLTVSVPFKYIQDGFRHLNFERPYDEKLHERITRSISRIAVGLDIPAELLLGLSKMNHWNAWLVQEETYKSHLEPIAMVVCDVLAAAANKLDAVPGHIDITPNPAEIMAKRSTVKDALEAAGMGAVGLAYVRDAIGASDTDAPSDEELALLVELGVIGRRGSTSTVAESPGPPNEGEPVVAALPVGEQALDSFGDQLERMDLMLRSELEGALEMSVEHARSKIGAKIRTAVRNDADLRAKIEGVQNSDVAATLGTDAIGLIDLETTIHAGIEPLITWWSRRMQTARAKLAKLTEIDTDTVEWKAAGERSVEELTDGLSHWLIETMTRRTSNMPLVPRNLVRDVVARAGGS